MSTSIGTTRVDEVMNTVVFTVGPKDKIPDVAALFDKHDVNAAPVVDESNVCVGMITSHDLVEYEAVRVKVMDHLDRGLNFDLGHYGDGQTFPLLRVPIDEVGIQMTTNVESVEPHTTLSHAARIMCEKHIHHLVILDEARHPVGILSSLDVLAHVTGEVVARRTKG